MRLPARACRLRFPATPPCVANLLPSSSESAAGNPTGLARKPNSISATGSQRTQLAAKLRAGATLCTGVH